MEVNTLVCIQSSPAFKVVIVRNSGLILLDKVPLNKQLARLIYDQLLLLWLIVVSYRFCCSNVSDVSQSSNVSKMSQETGSQSRAVESRTGPQGWEQKRSSSAKGTEKFFGPCHFSLGPRPQIHW